MYSTIDHDEISSVEIHNGDAPWFSLRDRGGNWLACVMMDPCDFANLLASAITKAGLLVPPITNACGYTGALNEERDAATTLGVEELRKPGASLCGATAGEPVRTPTAGEQLAAEYHAKAMAFVDGKLGLTL